jgi:hypothetical protein
VNKKRLAVPRGLPEFNRFNELVKSGTLNCSIGSLGFLRRVSHQWGGTPRAI